MARAMSRRAALAAGAGAGAALVSGGAALAAPPGTRRPVPGSGADGTSGVAPEVAADGLAGLSPVARIQRVYQRQKTRAGGVWHSYLTRVNETGTMETVIADDADRVTHGYSVQKLAVATAVMDKIDRGQLRLDQKLDLTADIILGGSGIYFLHQVWGDDITVANFLTAMLLVSDNTAVRMCGRVVPALELNDILAAKGFTHTRVEPVANPNRFFLGTTTPRETHDLLTRLANRTLLTPGSCDFLLGILRWINGYHDGVRRNMSSAERSRVATKYGADYDDSGAARHEAGIMYGADGSPALVYGFFADGLGDRDNYGATHPAVEAHATLGRVMFDTIASTTVPGTRTRTVVAGFSPVNGG